MRSEDLRIVAIAANQWPGAIVATLNYGAGFPNCRYIYKKGRAEKGTSGSLLRSQRK